MGGHGPHSLPHISIPALWYWCSGQAATGSRHLHGRTGERSCQAPRGSVSEKLRAAQWPFNDVPIPWILLEGYRNPDGAAPDPPGDDNQAREAEDSNGKGSGTAPDGPSAKSEDDKEDDDDEGFETVDDGDGNMGGKIVVKIPVKGLAKPEGSGLTGADRLFESDDEEEDAELKEQIEATYKQQTPLMN